jgi:hypothetical protein
MSVNGSVVFGPVVTLIVPSEDFEVLAASEIESHALYAIPSRFS